MKMIRRDQVLWLAVWATLTSFSSAGCCNSTYLSMGKTCAYSFDPGRFPSSGSGNRYRLGSFAAGYLSGGKIEYGLFLWAQWHDCPRNLPRDPGLVVALCCCCWRHWAFRGFFIVPISALIQHRPEEDKKGVVIGTANWLSFVGIGAASGVYYAATHFATSQPGGIFFWSALATLGATAYVLWLLPDSLLRLLLWIATNTLYRLDVVGGKTCRRVAERCLPQSRLHG